MKTLLLLSVLSVPSLAGPLPLSGAAPELVSDRGRRGGHPDGGKKKDEEEEEDCRVAAQDPVPLRAVSALS